LKVHRYFFNRGSKSRNKVAVGEPAAGSFSDDQNNNPKTFLGQQWFKIKTQTQNCRSSCTELVPRLLGARLSQRVAMDDLASYFVEERSKVR
jgi:hypothetical protein